MFKISSFDFSYFYEKIVKIFDGSIDFTYYMQKLFKIFMTTSIELNNV